MDDAQRFSVVAGVIILLACGVVYRGRRGWLLVATSTIGAVAFPRLLGLMMGYRAAVASVASSPGRFWRTELHELTAFYTVAPVADTTPRGVALGLLAGLAVGLLWPSRWSRLRRPPIESGHDH
jgi:hypothetical protein